MVALPKMRIALLSGAFPPQFDGIGDHTWWLSQALAEQNQEVTVLTSCAQNRPQPVNVEVVSFFDASEPKTISEALRALRRPTSRFDWLIVQYNPFSFGHRGFAPWLVPGLAATGIPIALMFHETFAVPMWPWQHVLMRLWQYPQFIFLVRTGRCHFVSTERWLAQVRQWARSPSFLLPVGSNLPLCQLTKHEARKRLGIEPDALVLGVFGFAHMSKRTEWIGAAARLIYNRFPKTLVLTVGQIGSWVRSASGDAPVHDHGSLPASEVSLRLRAMDLFLAPLTDGISARRGSIVAAFQHGLPICSTVRQHSDHFLRDFVSPAFSLTPSNNQTLFTEAALELSQKVLQQPDLGHDLVEFHDRHFAWPVIARRMLAGLSSAQPNGRSSSKGTESPSSFSG
jgi:glycosyltransferase involved in cell wall biosynthesis